MVRAVDKADAMLTLSSADNIGSHLPVAYLECAKGGGPGGLVPQWGPGAKPRLGSGGLRSPEADAFCVTEQDCKRDVRY